MPSPGLAGALLAGGKASRFGSDKLALTLPGRSQPVWSAPADALLAHAAPLAWVDPRPSRSPQFASLADPGDGPLPALALALQWAAKNGAEGLLVLAADLPAMTGEALRPLIEAWRQTDQAHAAFCALGATGRREPLCAIYPVAWFPQLFEQVDEGKRSARSAWVTEPIAVALESPKGSPEVTSAMTVPSPRRATIHPCFNLNRPQDWQLLQQWSQEEEPS